MEWMVDDRGRGWQIDEWTDKAHYVSAVTHRCQWKQCVSGLGAGGRWLLNAVPICFLLILLGKLLRLCETSEDQKHFAPCTSCLISAFSVWITHCKWAIVCSQYLWSVAKSLPATIVIITADCPYTSEWATTAVKINGTCYKAINIIFLPLKVGNLKWTSAYKP